jgi:4-carboxymuconolactone decarboxylase
MSRNSDFGTFGRYTELQLDEMTADQRKAYESTVGQRGEVPEPYKIRLQNPKLIEVMVPLDAYYQGHSSLSKAEIEIATNLTNARWLAGYSNYEHEIIVER